MTGPAKTRLLSVLVPVYNERRTIEEIIRSLFRVALPTGVEREVIVVDDGSSDGTPEVLRRLAGEHSRLVVHFQPENRGKGSAVREAIQLASGDFIVFQDADLEYDPADFSVLLPPLLDGRADVVYGSRFLRPENPEALRFWHTAGNRVLTRISNLFTGLRLTDMETCYKMARREILQSIPIRSDRFGMEPELTAKFARRGCRIVEVPVSYRGRTYREGKKITWWDGDKAILAIVYYRVVDDAGEPGARAGSGESGAEAPLP